MTQTVAEQNNHPCHQGGQKGHLGGGEKTRKPRMASQNGVTQYLALTLPE